MPAEDVPPSCPHQPTAKRPFKLDPLQPQCPRIHTTSDHESTPTMHEDLTHRLLQRQGIRARVLWTSPVGRVPPAAVDAQLKVVHHRVFNEEDDALTNFGRVRLTAREDGRGIELGFKVGLQQSAWAVVMYARCGRGSSSPRRPPQVTRCSIEYRKAQGSRPCPTRCPTLPSWMDHM